MNHVTPSPSPSSSTSSSPSRSPIMDHDTPTLQARFGLRLAAGLDELAARVPHDIDARLRFAREQALSRAAAVRAASAAPSPVARSGGSAVFGGWWMRLASVLPLALLVGGLVLIHQGTVDEQAEAMATLDTAVLADDLPPDAYRDPGFLAFLKTQPPTVTVQQ